MRFVWYLTFWGWSRESFRAGMLLHHPLEDIGSHWDEWYQSEASDADRAAIEEIGRSETLQREFVYWLETCWTEDAVRDDNRTAAGDRPVLAPALFPLGQPRHRLP